VGFAINCKFNIITLIGFEKKGINKEILNLDR